MASTVSAAGLQTKPAAIAVHRLRCDRPKPEFAYSSSYFFSVVSVLLLVCSPQWLWVAAHILQESCGDKLAKLHRVGADIGH